MTLQDFKRYLVSHSGSPDTIYTLLFLVFSSLPVFGLSILLCRLWGLWLDARISFQELTDLNEFDANSTFLVYHLCFDCPNKRRLSGHLRITMLASVIHKTSALLGFNVWALVPIVITTLASHLGIQSFPLSAFTISPAFPKAFWTWCCKQNSATLSW